MNSNNIVGQITPNVYVSSITLDGVKTNRFSANPHVHPDFQPDFEFDPLFGTKKIIKLEPNFKENEHKNVLNIKLDLVLKEVLKNGIIGTWFGQQDFEKYLKLQIYQFTNKNLFASVASNFNNLAYLDNKIRTLMKKTGEKRFFPDKTPIEENKIIQNGLEIKEICISDHISANKKNILSNFFVFDKAGNRIFDIPLQVQFENKELYPDFLSYLIFSYVDFEELANDLKIRSTLPNLFVPIGKEVAEVVIENGQINEKSFSFQTELGELWVGSVQEFNNEFFGQKDGQTIKLIQTEHKNTKIRDFRRSEKLDAQIIDFSFIQNLFNKVRLRQNIPLSSIKQDNGYISDLMFSRDDEGNCRFGFFVDIRKILVNNSIIGGLFQKKTENIASLLSWAPLQTLKIFRRRVQGSPEAGSKPNIHNNFETNQKEELLIMSGEKSFRTFIEQNREAGSLKEIMDYSIDGLSWMRLFSGIDKDMKDITDGYFVYDVVLELQDPTYGFIGQKITELQNARKELKRFYEIGSKIGSVSKEISFSDPHINFEGEKTEKSDPKPTNFDIALNRFTDKFVENSKTLFPTRVWETSIKTYLDILEMFSNLSTNDKIEFSRTLVILCQPETGTLAGIQKTISLIETLIQNLNRIIRSDLNVQGTDSASSIGYSSVSTSRTNRRIITITKRGIQPFDSNISPNIGLDYLDIQDQSLNGLKTINGLSFIERVERENNRYFQRNENLNEDISIIHGDQVYTQDDTLNKTSMTYLTPAKMKFSTHYELKRIGSSPTPKLSKEEISKASLLSKMTKTNGLVGINSSIDQTRDLSSIQQNNINNIGKILSNASLTLKTPSTILNSGLADIPQQSNAREASNEDKVVLDETLCRFEVPKEFIPVMPLFDHLFQNADIFGNNRGAIKINKNIEQISLSSKYDIRNEHNILKGTLQTKANISSELFFQGEQHTTTLNQALTSLPNQVKALFLGSIKEQIIKDDVLVKKLSLTEFAMNYQMINTILVLTGFENDGEAFPIVNSPIWAPLTPARFNRAIGKAILCRMRKYENELIGITRTKDFDLPLFDEFFLITPTTPIIVKIDPVKDIGVNAQQGTTQVQATELGNIQQSSNVPVLRNSLTESSSPPPNTTNTTNTSNVSINKQFSVTTLIKRNE